MEVTASTTSQTDAPPSGGERVLLVDDNPTNLQVLSEALSGQGFTLFVARSGEDALGIAAQVHPALVLLDINMPGIGGFETCRRLKADPVTADAVVMFLSARADAEDKVRGLELGAADYIAKPFNLDEVLARVRTHLESYREREDLAARNRELMARTGDSGGGLEPDQLRAMINEGESERLEFKSTLRWNLKADRAGKEIENAWLKTIVAFLNTDGGALIVGVDDGGTALGIETDQFANGDRYLLHANNLIRTTIGPDLSPFIQFALKPIDDKEVLVVQCQPSSRPVFLKRDGDEGFYVRIGPGSRQLRASEILSYVETRAAASKTPEVRAAPSLIAPGGDAASRVLLVDDTPTNLQVLLQTLEGQGYELLVATTGEDALTIATDARPDLILLDIMMPGIDGFETCRRLKASDATRDAAVIFMSALNETRDKVRGLELGAVDYITKPFQTEEVLARVDTHLTIQRLQRDLTARNEDLNDANERMKRDLLAAVKVQQSLLPRKHPGTDRAAFAWHYEPCDELAGDSLSVFSFDDRFVGMYVLDVSGHGVPAALLSVSVTHSLLLRDPEHSLITHPQREREEKGLVVSPATVATSLNLLFPMADSASRYFTMVYAVLDTHTNRVRYVGAGHPGPMVFRADGSVDMFDSTGLPVGVAADATFEVGEVQLEAGDRMYLYSDGAFEEMNHDRETFGIANVKSVLADGRAASLDESLSSVIRAIQAWADAGTLSDDVSLVAMEIGTA